mmetsp:Transcript_32719/g.38367  ORF Transcript_32719/g.38367 Transcript_32719/m.38367 type:complete len:115 (+) Transcript_32719:43-387(+)
MDIKKTQKEIDEIELVMADKLEELQKLKITYDIYKDMKHDLAFYYGRLYETERDIYNMNMKEQRELVERTGDKIRSLISQNEQEIALSNVSCLYSNKEKREKIMKHINELDNLD